MSSKATEKVTISTLRRRKQSGQKFPVLTCYDHPTAQVLCRAGIDVLLVGDSYGQVVLGLDSTLPVTTEMMVTICAAVRRGAPTAFIIGDMPFLSYQVSIDEAIHNAGRLVVEGGCQCVKLEVDRRLTDVVQALSRASIPVMAHLGLRPQALHEIGGYKVQGRDAEAAMRLIEDAKIMEQAGAVALLLEAVPPEPAKIIAESTELPVIGCGAGPHCDGHVVVLHDILGWLGGTGPRFAKRYADIRRVISRAARHYAQEVRDRQYPASEHSYQMHPGEVDKLYSLLQQENRDPEQRGTTS